MSNAALENQEHLNESELDSDEPRRGGLGLTPNEVIGYRIVPDEHNWTVMLVRKHGASSKHAGEEYFRPLAYCKSLEFAAQWILNRDSRAQAEMFELTEAMRRAQEEVKKAVHALAEQVASGAISLPSKAPILDAPSTPKETPSA